MSAIPAPSASSPYAKMLARGCLCGTDRIVECPLHGPGDNRGIAAWFKVGMPRGFPIRDCHCRICGTGGCTMYPSLPLDRGEIPAGSAPPPTLICPRCSVPEAEAALRRDCQEAGYALNEARVFA